MKKSIKLKHVMALALSVSTLTIQSTVIDALSSSPTSPSKEAPVANKAEKDKGGDHPVTEAKLADVAKPVDAAKSTETNLAETKAVPKPCNTVPLNFDISQGFSSIAEKAVLAVVNVSTTQIIEGGRFGGKEGGVPQFAPGSPFEDFFKEFFDQMQPHARKVQSLGSGFIIQSDDASAIIVTNYHVIADAKKVTIFLHDNTELEASVLAIDERTDIALLKVKTDSLPADKRKLPTMEWADCSQSKVGDWVLAIGNPFGLGSTVTSGIISNRARDITMGGRNGGRGRVDYVDDFIQHDASINMGNSGGPLLNLEGKVIAINTAIYSPSGGSVGIGFAIPASVAQETVTQLLKFGRTKRGWLGVRFQPVTEDIAESLGLGKARGGIVGSVTPGGPAAKAGMEPGDIILSFDDKELNDKTKLQRLVGETPVGKKVKVKVWRKGSEKMLDMVLGEFETGADREIHPADAAAKSKQEATEVLGIKLTALTPELKERFKLSKDAKGILVLKVDINSTAMEIGLKTGDVIEKVNQKEVNEPKEFASAVEDAKKAKYKHILLLVSRDGDPRFAPLKLENEDFGEAADSKNKDSDKEAKKPETLKN
jgi:serine protease Do